MNITPDTTILWNYGFIKINLTILHTWITMALLGIGSWSITRRLSMGTPLPFWQNVLEVILLFIRDIVRETTHHKTDAILIFAGTLFLFIGLANILSIIPGYTAPTGSLSTTTALAMCVFIAVPVFGISHVGLKNYLANYLRPTIIMLPFNIIGEISRTLALAIRLFGNIMSSTMIGAILLLVIPIIFPVLMQLMGLLTGVIQAYIFAVLAVVYIASGMEVQKRKKVHQRRPDGG